MELIPAHFPQLPLRISVNKPTGPNEPGSPRTAPGRGHWFILDGITPSTVQEDAASPDVPPFTFFTSVQLAATATLSAFEFQNKITQVAVDG